MNISQIPARVTAGAFLLNSGLGKRNLPDETAAQLQEMGSVGVPQLKQMSPAQFGSFISATEIGIGAALLAPFVPGWLAGAALGAFTGGLLNMYRKTPGMTIDGIRPTQEGTAIAKDVFMAGIAGSLILNSLGNQAKKTAKKATKKAVKGVSKK